MSEELGAFVAGLGPADIPAPIRHRAVLLLLDAIGVALASSSFAFGRRAAAALGRIEGGRFPVIGLPDRLSMRDAALVNGILIHGIDSDDTSIDGRIHPSSACVPAALSLGTHLGASGRDVLTAYVAALEGSIRLGAVAKGGFQRRGFHPTGIIGSFGAAFAAARLFRLDPEQTAMAQGIAYSTASGNQSFAAEMAWTKRFHPGWAAVGGITAAALAKGGFVGPREPFEGRFGLYSLYLGKEAAHCDLSLATQDLGSRWMLDQISLMRDGAVYEAHQRVDRGSPERPLSEEETMAKFRANAERVFDPARARSLQDLVLDIERLGNVETLTEQLSGLPGRRSEQNAP